MESVPKNKGGRPKGARNKANRDREAKIAASGMTPLDFLISVVQNRNADGTPGQYATAERLDAAKASAPYVHSKMPAELQITDPEGTLARLLGVDPEEIPPE